jgi:Ca2+-binding EF-hand superfamily protein
VRHTQQDYQNVNTLKLSVPSNSVTRDAEELDREYRYKMQQVGLPGLCSMERMAKQKLEQKNVQTGLANFRRAFEPYDHDQSGQCGVGVFRKALEVAGLQFTEDQVMALFGYYDKDRKGTIDYQKWVANVAKGAKLSQKAWDSAFEWAERERKWAALEEKWEKQNANGAEANQYPDANPGDVRAQLEYVYNQFFELNQDGEWAVTSPKLVHQWMLDAGLRNVSIEQARRLVYQLDPCDRDAGVMTLDELAAWWDLSDEGRRAVMVSKSDPMQPEKSASNNQPTAYTPYWAI